MDLDQEVLVNELTQGRELANRLKIEFDTISISSKQTQEFLLDQILSTYEKALSLFNWSALLESQNSNLNPNPKSPNTHSGNTQRRKIDFESKEDVSKKRKLNLTKWSKKVNLSAAKGNCTDDGYSWRKYGQKDILGAKFPRAYYRCAHRPTQGCLATKQVQKSDEDSSIVEISYRGNHTCVQTYHKPKTEENRVNFFPQQQPKQEQVQTKTREFLFNFQGNFKTDNSAILNEDVFTQFTFPPTPFGSEITESELFTESAMENNLMDTSCFSSSPYYLNNLELNPNFQSSDSDLGEIISCTNSVTNSPCENLDYLLDQVDFDSLDILESFS